MLMAEEHTQTEEGVAPDLSEFIPEQFKKDDGFDLASFRQTYDDLSAFKAAEDDRMAALPKEAAEYEFFLPEDHAFPEGFNPELLATTDEEGNRLEFDASKMLDANDPDIPAVQEILKELGAPKEAMGKIASIMVNREIRQTMKAMEQAGEEKKSLGPDADNRINTVTRTLNARLPKEQATAIADSITSADALRGLEALMKKIGATTPAAPGKPDYSEMSVDDRILAGLQQRGKRA